MNDLARRYAQALYGLTDDEKALRRTAGALMEDTTLWSAFRSPAVRAEEKERILARLPDLEGCGTLLHFYQLLAVKGRMDLLPEILDAFQDLALAQRDCARCVLSPVPGLWRRRSFQSSALPYAGSITSVTSSLTSAWTPPCWAASHWNWRASRTIKASGGRWPV